MIFALICRRKNLIKQAHLHFVGCIHERHKESNRMYGDRKLCTNCGVLVYLGENYTRLIQ